MGKEDGVEAGDALGQRLHAQLRPAVDEDMTAFIGLDVDARAGALVAPVTAGAGLTAAADDWHAIRGRRPEEQDPHQTDSIVNRCGSRRPTISPQMI